MAGADRISWEDGRTQDVGPGDVMAFDSRVPHQLTNGGTGPFVAVSVYWLDGAHEPDSADDA